MHCQVGPFAFLPAFYIGEYLSHPPEYQLQTIIFHLIYQFYSFVGYFGSNFIQIGEVSYMLLAQSFANVCFLG